MDAENLRKEQRLKNRTNSVELFLIHFVLKSFGENIFFSVKKKIILSFVFYEVNLFGRIEKIAL